MTTRETGTVHGSSPTLADVRERFGGVDIPASIVGVLTALGVMALLSALLAIGDEPIPLQMNLTDTEGVLLDVDGGGFAVALGVVFVGFVVGGWAAGRMARFDGGLNGLATGFWMLVVIVGFGAIGTWVGEEYNALAIAELPDWMSQAVSADATTAAVITAIAAVVVMFIAAWIGGRLGETYHHSVDAAIVHATLESTRPDVVADMATEQEIEVDRDVVEVVDDVADDKPDAMDSSRGDTASV